MRTLPSAMRPGIAALVALVAIGAILLAGTSASAQGSVQLQSPTFESRFDPGDEVAVRGRLLDRTTGAPIGWINVTAQLLDDGGRHVPGTTRTTTAAGDGGFFMVLELPSDLEGGTYALLVRTPDPEIDEARVTIFVAGADGTVPPDSLRQLIAVSFVVAALGVAGMTVWLLRPSNRRTKPL